MGDADLASQLEDAVNLAQELHAQVQQKQDVIEELRTRIESLQESRGVDPSEDMELILERLTNTENELEEARDKEKEQESRARELEMKCETLKLEKMHGDGELLKLQEKLEEMEESMHAAQQKTEQAADAEGRLGAREKSHKKTLIKCLAENEELHHQVADLQEQLLTIGEAYQTLEETSKEKDTDLSLARQELQDAENEIQELKRINQETEKELAIAQDEVAAVGELEAETQARVGDAVKEWTLRVRAVESELEQARQENSKLASKCDEMKRASGVKILEEQLKASQDRIAELQQEIEDLKETLSESREELTDMANELLLVKQDSKSIIDAALEEERKEIEVLKHNLTIKDDRIAEERARHEDLLNDKAQIEKELQDREFWMAEYERGHGLTEAVAHQKKLKADIKRRDKEIARLNQLLSKRIAGYQKLSEVCRRLKQDAGIPIDFEYDDIEIEEGMKGEVQRLEGLIKELETQNNSLEDERLRLLQSLRVSAQTQGEKGMKYYGLSAEQMTQVNQFIENLREGRVDLPLNDRSRELLQQLEQMKEEVREAQRDAAIAEAKLSAFQSNPTSFSGFHDTNPALGDQHLPGAPQEHQSLVTNNSHIAEHFEILSQKQESLVRDLGKSLQDKLSTLAVQQQSKEVNSSSHDARLDEMLAVLEKRLNGGEQLNAQQAREMQTELQRLMVQNTRLQEELVRAKSTSNQISVDLDPGPTPKPKQESTAHSTTAAQLDLSRAALGTMALSVPQTSAGKSLHESIVGDLRLPPEKWSDQFIQLNAQLVDCFEELAERNKTIEALQKSMKNYSGDITELTDRQALLYREHALKKQQWAEQLRMAQTQRDDAIAERDALQSKSRRLDTLCAVLEGSEENVRDHVRELTRKLAYFEVNEVVMARKYNLLVEEEKHVRSDKLQLRKDFVEMEATLKERCLYLEQWKANTKSELNRLHQRLSKRVPEELHKVIAQQLASTKDKLRRTMVEQVEIVSTMAKCQSLQGQVRELVLENENLKVQVEESKQRVEASRKQVEWMQSKSATAIESEGMMNHVEKLVQQIATVQGQLTEKEILLSSAVKRTEILEGDRVVLQGTVKDVEEQLCEMRKQLEQQNQTAQKTSNELEQLKEAYQGGATAKERSILEDRVSELEDMYESMSREVVRSNELADIASSQVQSMEAIKQCDTEELESLRERLRNANARTDDDAIIGKLQHGLTTVKASYKRFVKEHERARVALKKKDLELRKVELRLDEKESVVRKVREQAQNHVQSLSAAVERMQGELGNGLDGISLYRVERLHTDVQDLASKLREAERVAESASRVRANLQLEVDKQAEELDTISNQCQNYELLLKNMDDENRMALSNQLVNLTKELQSCRLKILKHDRELTAAKSEKEYLEQTNRENEEHIERLEQVVAQTESERHLIYAEGPQLPELPYEDSSGHGEPTAVRKSSRISIETLLEQTDNVSGNQSDETLCKLLQDMQQQNEDLSKSRATISQLQSDLRKSDQVVLQLKKGVQRHQDRIAYLRKLLKAEGVDETVIGPDGDVDQVFENEENMAPPELQQPRKSISHRKRLDYHEADSQKTKVAAQKTIASLKEIVDRKNKAIDSYKNKIKRMQLDAVASRDRDQAEIERLTEHLYDENKAAIGKLRSAFEDISNSSNTGENSMGGQLPGVDSGLFQEMVARNEEADRIIESKERSIRELQNTVTELGSELEMRTRRQQQAEEECEHLQEKLRRQILKSEVQASDRTVKNLKAQVISKERKIASMRAALVVLKTEFVKAEEEYNLSQANAPPLGRSGSEHQDDSSERGSESLQITNELRRQVDALKRRVEQTRLDLEKAKQLEDKHRGEIRKLRSQVTKAVDGSDQHAEQLEAAIADARRYQRQIDELLRENQRLKDTVAQSVRLNQNRRASSDHTTGSKQQQQQKSLSASMGPSVSSSTTASEVRKLQRRIQVLEAQNAAMRSAAVATARSADRTPKRGDGSSTSTNQPKHGTDKNAMAAPFQAPSPGNHLRQSSGRLSQRPDAKSAQVESRLRQEVSSLTTKVSSYKQQVDILQAQITKLKRSVARQQPGRRGGATSPSSVTSRKGVKVSPRSNNSDVLDLTQIEQQMQLRDELHQANQTIRKLESKLERQGLVSSQNTPDTEDQWDTVTELRFELAQQARELSALVLRNKELEAYRKVTQQRGVVRSSKYDSQDMEQVVESLKAVIDKLKSENNRLTQQVAQIPKQRRAMHELKQMREEHLELVSEVEQLRSDSRDVRVLRTDVSRLERQLGATKRENKSLKKQLALAQESTSSESPVSRNNDVRDIVSSNADERISQLEKNVEAKEEELADKDSIVKQIRHENRSLKLQSDLIRRERDELKTENARLVSELGAFDLDFFEEIEDLKYRYHQLLEENKALRR